MALEHDGEQQYRECPDKYHDPGVSYAMTTRDYTLRPRTLHAPIVITLPPVAEATGRFYSIIARQADPVNTITIQDRDDSECWLADIVLNGPCDRVLLYSDGLAWHPLGLGPGDWPGVSTTKPPGTETPTTLAPTTVA